MDASVPEREHNIGQQTAAAAEQTLNQGDGAANRANPSASNPAAATTTTPPAPPPAAAVPKIRSCVTCRRRKVRCNKQDPCSNCVRAGADCVFPGPARAPRRRSRKVGDAELLARLKKLEGVVHHLGASVDEADDILARSPSVAATADTAEHGNRAEASGGGGGGRRSSTNNRKLGRLIISDDRSRYVSNQFWACMSDEIAEMHELLDVELTDDEESSESPAHDRVNSHQSFVFGYSSLMVDLKALHPTPGQVFVLWDVFRDNVDPVVRLLHRPTAKDMFTRAASRAGHLSRPAEALLFALYLGAVVSLTDEQCGALLGEARDALLQKYRFAAEQALARADFLNSSSLVCLQAFTLFLIFVRHMDDTRALWSLSGMALHLAQVLGIHRDGTHFGLAPFDTEMRRRLWWHISIIDSRAAEEHGAEPMFSEQFYDTRLPLNVNDEDLYPGMKEAPPEREGATEMTFCLIRFELIAFGRRLNLTHHAAAGRSGQRVWEEKESMIDACHRRIEDKYVRHCDTSRPIFWVCATVARLVLAKMWLMVHQPRSTITAQGRQTLPGHTRERLFITAVEVIEFARLLETHENTARWAWLFRTYMHWQSVAFVLAEICQRPGGSAEVQRALHAVESIYDPAFRDHSPRTVKAMLWKPIRQLMVKARAIHGLSSSSTNTNTAAPDQRRGGGGGEWKTIFPHPTVLSETAEALDLDLWSWSHDQRQQTPDQPAVDGQLPESGNGSNTLQQNTTADSERTRDVGNWDAGTAAAATPAAGGSPRGVEREEPEPLLHYFHVIQQEWF